VIRLALLSILASTQPSYRQNVAITDDGQPICGAVQLTENLVLTAGHCVHDKDEGFADYVEVRCGSVDQPAQVVKASLDDDLAVLRFVMPCHEHKLTQLAFSNPPVGTQVHAIGYPAGHPRISSGIVSAYEVSELQSSKKHPVLVSDTKIYYGNSGGGLFNPNGELVGIASQLDRAGYGYWIPASSIHKFLDGI
jgi:serine protease Do